MPGTGTLLPSRVTSTLHSTPEMPSAPSVRCSLLSINCRISARNAAYCATNMLSAAVTGAASRSATYPVLSPSPRQIFEFVDERGRPRWAGLCPHLTVVAHPRHLRQGQPGAVRHQVDELDPLQILGVLHVHRRDWFPSMIPSQNKVGRDVLQG